VIDQPDQFAGMSVYQRLLAAGLLEAFEKAAARKDRPTMIHMLGTVHYEDAASAVDEIL
jgi:hypothetical protein